VHLLYNSEAPKVGKLTPLDRTRTYPGSKTLLFIPPFHIYISVATGYVVFLSNRTALVNGTYVWVSQSKPRGAPYHRIVDPCEVKNYHFLRFRLFRTFC